MRLNFDCVRDLLLKMEELCTPSRIAVFVDTDLLKEIRGAIEGEEEITVNDYQAELNKKYNNEVLIYHINYCIKAGLLEYTEASDQAQIAITDLTPYGHEFLGNIRKDSIFKKVMTIAGEIGAITLPAITQISSNLVTEMIKTYIK